MEEKKKKIYKKWWFWVIIILILAGIAGSDNSNNNTSTENIVTSNLETAESTDTIEPNSTKKVDYLIKKAKDNSTSITNEQKDIALDFIKSNVDNFFKDNQTMEDAIYYGALLEYSCNDNLKELGMDTVQAVKYVYRNVEKVEDISTQENLKQIKENLNSLQ